MYETEIPYKQCNKKRKMTREVRYVVTHGFTLTALTKSRVRDAGELVGKACM